MEQMGSCGKLSLNEIEICKINTRPKTCVKRVGPANQIYVITQNNKVSSTAMLNVIKLLK